MKSPRRDKRPRRLRDIAPDDVEVAAVEEESEAKDSDTEPSPSKQRRPRGKKGQQAKKKSNGWIWAWFEMVTTAAHGTDTTKLAQYKNESKRLTNLPVARSYVYQVCAFSGSARKRRCTAG